MCHITISLKFLLNEKLICLYKLDSSKNRWAKSKIVSIFFYQDDDEDKKFELKHRLVSTEILNFMEMRKYYSHWSSFRVSNVMTFTRTTFNVECSAVRYLLCENEIHQFGELLNVFWAIQNKCGKVAVGTEKAFTSNYTISRLLFFVFCVLTRN